MKPLLLSVSSVILNFANSETVEIDLSDKPVRYQVDHGYAYLELDTTIDIKPETKLTDGAELTLFKEFFDGGFVAVTFILKFKLVFDHESMKLLRKETWIEFKDISFLEESVRSNKTDFDTINDLYSKVVQLFDSASFITNTVSKVNVTALYQY